MLKHTGGQDLNTCMLNVKSNLREEQQRELILVNICKILNEEYQFMFLWHKKINK